MRRFATGTAIGNDQPRRPDLTEVERQIAGLADRSTQDLRVAWRQLHRIGPPLGLTLASAKEQHGRVYRVDRPASV